MNQDSLSLPSAALIERISGYKVLEVGAGAGVWLGILRRRGIDVIGIDPRSDSPDVIKADHTAISRWPDRDLMLVVWPPDHTDLAIWAEGWTGDIMVVGSFARFTCPPWPIKWEATLPPGRKGGSQVRLMG